MDKRLPIAVGAGLVSGLLFIAAVTGAVTSLMVLVLLTPLPIAIAGFSWGWLFGLIAAATAAGFLAIVGTLTASLFHFLLFGLPSAVAVYYLLLSRTHTDAGGRQETEWYPIGRVAFAIAIFSGTIAAVALLSLGSSMQELQAHVAKVVERMMDADIPWPGGADKKPTPEQMQDLITLLTASFSAAIAGFWMWLTLFNLWVGAKVARASGLLIRPWPNVSMVALPRWAGLVLAGTVAASMLGDYPGLIATGFATGIFIAFLLVGLAIVHNVTWNQTMRPIILVGVYAFLIFFNPFSSLAIASLALFEPFFPLRNAAHGGRHDPPNQSANE